MKVIILFWRTGMVIRIKKVDYDSIVRYCLDGLPNESCGLIAGFTDGDVKVIEKVYFLTNLDHNNVHFTMDPKEQFAAVKDARSLGLTMLGNFHSHPETPSRPSEEDKRLAYDSTAVYMIMSFMDNDNPIFSFPLVTILCLRHLVLIRIRMLLSMCLRLCNMNLFA